MVICAVAGLTAVAPVIVTLVFVPPLVTTVFAAMAVSVTVTVPAGLPVAPPTVTLASKLVMLMLLPPLVVTAPAVPVSKLLYWLSRPPLLWLRQRH